MPSVVTFTSGALSLQSVQLQNAVTLRIRYTVNPKSVSPTGLNDALNPANYILTGISAVYVISVSSVPFDSQSFDLNLSSILNAGSWNILAVNIQTPTGSGIVSPTNLNFVSPGFTVLGPLSGGAENEDSVGKLKNKFNPAFKGKFWDAILAALGSAVNTIEDQVRAAYYQYFLSTASGQYLDERASDRGLVRPLNVGMSDDDWRKLCIRFTSNKLTQDALYRILEVFYGSTGTRAFVTSFSSNSFALTDGDDLILSVDGKIINITFRASQFKIIQQATPAEVCSVITSTLFLNNNNGWADYYKDPEDGTTKIRIFSGALGQKGYVQVLGGRSQRVFEFSDRVLTRSSNTNTGVTVGDSYVLTVPSTGILKIVSSGSTGTDFSQVHVGDYVQIQGTNFATVNKGNFTVKTVDIRYILGVLTQSIELENSNALAQATVSITSTSDMMFFRPSLNKLNESSVTAIVSNYDFGSNSFSVVLPVTTEVVDRTLGTAAYLRKESSVDISSIFKSFNSYIDITTASAHGIVAGQQVLIENFEPSDSFPIGTLSTYATNWKASSEILFLFRAGISKYENNNFLIWGGKESDGAPTYIDKVQHISISVVDDPIDGGRYFNSSALLTVGTFSERISLINAVSVNKNVSVCAGGLRESGEASDVSAVYSYGTFTEIKLATRRVGHWILSDNSGRVWVGNGINTPGSSASSLNTIEVVDSNVFSSWSSGGTTLKNRAYPGSVKLSDGRFMIAGGFNRTSVGPLLPETTSINGIVLSHVEIFDPVTRTATETGNLCVPRLGSKLFLVPGDTSINDKVYCVGGMTQTGDFPKTIEIWEAQTGRWRPFANLSEGRMEFGAEVFLSRNELVVYGGRDPSGNWIASTEIVNLLTGKIHKITSSPNNYGYGQATALLDEGDALVSIGVGRSKDALNVEYEVLFGENNIWCRPHGINELSTVLTGSGTALTVRNNIPGVAQKRVGSTPVVTKLSQQPAVDQVATYTLDPLSGFKVTAVSTTISQSLNTIDSYRQVQVSSVLGFDPTGGWVVLDFGTDRQSIVKYVSIVAASNIIIFDGDYRFTTDLPVGTSCMFMETRNSVTNLPIGVSSFFVTDSLSGRIAALDFLNKAKPSGIKMNVDLQYPGDRGLGNQGYPITTGSKKSDVVRIWG